MSIPESEQRAAEIEDVEKGKGWGALCWVVLQRDDDFSSVPMMHYNDV